LGCFSEEKCWACSGINRDNITLSCECLDGFSDYGYQVDCVSCSYRCRTCENAMTCTKCHDTRNISAFCVCSKGFYETIGENKSTCYTCNFKCSECISLVDCTECSSPNRVVSDSCVCE
jgi:hypothetical protein